MLTIEQIRAARALLDWSQSDLADRAGLSQTGIARIENGTNKPNTSTLNKIEAAFTSANIEFINGGVRTLQDRLLVYEGKDSLRKLQDDIYHTLSEAKQDDKEVLLLGIDELDEAEPTDYQYTLMHIKRLQDKGISERIIVEDAEDSFIAPKHWYRSIDKRYFSPHTVFIYGSKVALNLRAPHYKGLVLDNPFFAETLKAFFNYIWEQARPVTETKAKGQEKAARNG